MSEKLTKHLIASEKLSSIHQAQILNLKNRESNLLAQLEEKEIQIAQLDSIINSQSQISELQDDQIELSEKEIQRIKRREKWKSFWNQSKEIIIGIVAGSSGLGIGYGIGSLR
jgi:hypothetical protein